jgi:hypothetical protein
LRRRRVKSPIPEPDPGPECRERITPMGVKPNKSVDPLFQLFEHYLLNRSYEDSNKFTKEVAEEYMTYLDSTSAHVPFHVRSSLLEDLETETHELLVRKMYGCVRAADYVNSGTVISVRPGEDLTTFEFETLAHPEENQKKS